MRCILLPWLSRIAREAVQKMVPHGPPELKKRAKCPNASMLFPEALEGWYNDTTEEKSEHIVGGTV